MVQLRSGKTTQSIRQRSPVRPYITPIANQSSSMGKSVLFSSKIDPDIQNHLLTQVDSDLFNAHTPHLSAEAEPSVPHENNVGASTKPIPAMQIAVPRFYWAILLLGFFVVLGSSSVIYPPSLYFDSQMVAQLNPWTGKFDFANKNVDSLFQHIPNPGPVNSEHIPNPGPVNSEHIPNPGPVNSEHIPNPGPVNSEHIPNPGPVDSSLSSTSTSASEISNGPVNTPTDSTTAYSQYVGFRPNHHSPRPVESKFKIII